MARSEARLAASIWDDPDFLALNPTAQRMFMFLLSQRDLAHDGVIALRERRWSRSAAGLTPAQVDQDLKELHATRFIVVDEDVEELLIRSFIRRDKVYRQPNVLRAAADHLEVVASPIVRQAIAAEVRRILDAEDLKDDTADILRQMLAAIGDPLPSPPNPPPADTTTDVSAGNKGSGNPSANPSDMPTAKGSQLRPGERGVVTVVPQGVSPYPVLRAVPPPAAHAATPPDAPTADPPPKVTTQTLVGEWIERCRDRPPKRVIGPVSKHVKDLLDEGVHPDNIRRGLAAWMTKGLDPAKLPSVVNEVMNARPDQARASPAGDGLIEHNGMRLKPENVARLQDRARFQAMDAAGINPLAIEGPA